MYPNPIMEEFERKFPKLYSRITTNHSWYNKSYSGYFFGLSEQGLAISNESIRNPYALQYGLFFQNYKEKDHFDWFWDISEMKEKRGVILEKIKSDPKFTEEVLAMSQANHIKFVGYNDKIAHFDLENATNESLKETFFALHKLLIDVSVWSYAVDAFLSDEGEDWLVTLIKGSLGEKATSDVIETLTLPTFSSFVNDAEGLFLEVVLALKDGDFSKAQEKALEYQESYFWIRSNYREYKRVTSEEIIAEAKVWLEKNSDKDITSLIKHESDRVEENKSKKDALCKMLALDPELRKILRFSEIFTHLQDKRKERVLRMNTLMYEFVAETQKRFEISSPLGFYLTDTELFGLYEGRLVDLGKIKERYEEGCMAVYYEGSVSLIPAKEYKRIGMDKNFFKILENTKEIKGTTAYKGVVKGVARILRNVKDISLFTEGEILIANQTTPEYVPAMKKAAAIVTDQGGITCHAAIVARELKLPAIIGTKIATQAIKDGDLIEVDAVKGIITILNR